MPTQESQQLLSSLQPAILVLEDGSVFHGSSIGFDGQAIGEVGFNTAMTGYQEILTDPSYAKQIVTLTYPHIGNTGINSEDVESDQVWAEGLIIRDLPLLHSNWRSEESLSDYLKRTKKVAIADIDTRRLTRILRDKGAQSGCIIAGDIDEAKALDLAKGFPGLKGMDLAKEVCTKEQYDWNQTSWDLVDGYGERQESKFKVVAYDYGVKKNILRMLADRGCDLTVVPAQTPAKDVLAMNPDGIFLSNGPGDPEPCDYAIKAIQDILETDIPVFGICLGHQLLALASGAKSIKMKFGHHGANHPVKTLESDRVMITSQNHGFAVINSEVDGVKITHINLNDDTVEGVESKVNKCFSVQYHPEGSPGPHDSRKYFKKFVKMI